MVTGDCTPLIAAAAQGNETMVRLLLAQGADVNMVAGGRTPLIAAAAQGNEAMVRLLLDQHADMNIELNHRTALGVVVNSDHIDIDLVKLLLDRGAGVIMVEGQPGSALIAAICRSQSNPSINKKEPELLSMLLDRKPDAAAVGVYGTALIASICQLKFLVEGSTRVGWEWSFLEKLLVVEDNINVVCGEHGTPLITAISMKKVQLVELLVANGADPNRLTGHHGNALGAALAAGLQPQELLQVVRFLLDNGADINAVSCGQFGSALAKASYMGNTELVLFLLARGADPFNVGGTYTRAGRCPNALDAAQSSGSKAGPGLVALLSRAVKLGRKSKIPPSPPFPMPCISSCTILRARKTPANMDSEASACIDFHSICNLPANITPQQADIPCTAVNEEVLVQVLVQLVIGIYTKTPEFEHYEDLIRNDVRYFVSKGYDFGLAYAAARVGWKRFNEPAFLQLTMPHLHRGHWLKVSDQIGQARVKSIYRDNTGHEMIKQPYDIMPRRLWDLRSNRVVEFQMLHSEVVAHKYATDQIRFGKAGNSEQVSQRSQIPGYWAITHSWESTMEPVETPINQYQWQVPFPHGLDIDHLRQQLLSYDIAYAWLDVLCLRQHTSIESNRGVSQVYAAPHTSSKQNASCVPAAALNKLKIQEWKLDVPTIGNIYRAAQGIVRYFNGVGRPFRIEGWDNSRHWLRRAWTLQEITNENSTINGGIPRHSTGTKSTPNIMNTRGKVGGKMITLRRAIRPILKLAAEIDSPGGCSLYGLVREMSRRDSTQATDKVAGLLYLLRPTQLPTYSSDVSDEDAWMKCFHVLPFGRKIELLFDFPYRGDAGPHKLQWFPTWGQLLKWPRLDPDCDYNPAAQAKGHRQLDKHNLADPNSKEFGELVNETSLFVSDIWGISSSQVTVHSAHADHANDYEVEVEGKIYGFYCPYVSQEPIPRAVLAGQRFTLATPDLGPSTNWVLCEVVGTLETSCRLDSRGETNPNETQNSIELEIEVLRKVGVFRTDFCGEILATKGGHALRRINALFV